MVDVATSEEFQELTGRVSELESAPPGSGTGEQGPPGMPMDTWQGKPTQPGVQDGQTMLDTLTGDVYGWGTEWGLVGNIKGPKGDPGEPGPPGSDGGGGGSTPAPSGEALAGFRNWDSFGGSDNDRVEAINDYHQNHGGQPTDTIAMPARIVRHSVPLKLFSGSSYKGPTTAREYSRHAALQWDGPAGSAQFIFPPEGQSGQSYPSDGSPRDITWENIQFLGDPDNHHIEWFDVHSNAYTSHTLWYVRWANCGWSYFKTAWSGWGTGAVISGTSHIQGIGLEQFAVGGSENRIHGGEYGLSDAQPNLHQKGGLPSIHCHFARGLIGDALVSVRGDRYGLLIDYGNNIYVHGLGIDSPNSEPHLGASVKIKGGKNITLEGLSLKGGMHNPGAATGDQNRGLIDIAAGDSIVLSGINAIREGTNAPTDTPVVYVGVGAKKVLIQSVNCSGFDGVVAIENGADVTVLDPRLQIRQVGATGQKSQKQQKAPHDYGFGDYLERMRQTRDEQ